MKKILTFGGKLLKNAMKGVPVLDSIRKAVVAFYDSKFDPKKLLWVLVEMVSVLCVAYLTLAMAKKFGLTVEDIMGLIEQIMKLGLGS